VNKNNVIKWVLIAGAAYLVYRYLQSSGILGGKALPAAEPEQEPAPTPAPATSVAPSTTVAASTTSAASISQSLTAAMQEAGYDPNAEYDGYQWAWFWQHSSLYNGAPLGPTELGIGQQEKVLMPVAVEAVGRALSGLHGLEMLRNLMATPRMLSAWTM